jgi:hypothetical protein
VVPFQGSGGWSVRETTYFGRVFMRTAKSPSMSSIDGQAAAKPANVSRPSSKASLAQSCSVWYLASS